MLYEFLEKTHIDKKVYFYLLFIADLFCTFFASICAVGFLSIITQVSYSTAYILLFLGSSVIFGMMSYAGLRTCSFAVRHSTFHEIGILIGAVLIKNILMGAALAIMHLHQGFSFPHLVALLLLDVLRCHAADHPAQAPLSRHPGVWYRGAQRELCAAAGSFAPL